MSDSFIDSNVFDEFHILPVFPEALQDHVPRDFAKTKGFRARTFHIRERNGS